jgi:hypothetical protein
MEELFTPRYQWLWTAILALLLFFPIRQLIWVLSVRREERKTGTPPDEARRSALKRRASVTSGLLCLVFSVIYVDVLYGNLYAPQ